MFIMSRGTLKESRIGVEPMNRSGALSTELLGDSDKLGHILGYFTLSTARISNVESILCGDKT